MHLSVPVHKFCSVRNKKWKEQGAVTNKPRMDAPWKTFPLAIAKLNKGVNFRNKMVEEMAFIVVNVTR